MRNNMNIDFEDTVEFVWNWTTKLNAHLLAHGWGTVGGKSTTHVRGLTTSNLTDLSSKLLEMILSSEDPHHFMKAMNHQMQAFQSIAKFPELPRSYVKIIENRNGSESSRWNLEIFTEALRTDINRIVQLYKLVEKEAELQYAGAVKKQKM